MFGKVVSGQEFVLEIENQKVDGNHRPYADIRVSNCGELVAVVRKKQTRADPSGSESVTGSETASSETGSSTEVSESESVSESEKKSKRKRKERRKAKKMSKRRQHASKKVRSSKEKKKDRAKHKKRKRKPQTYVSCEKASKYIKLSVTSLYYLLWFDQKLPRCKFHNLLCLLAVYSSESL